MISSADITEKSETVGRGGHDTNLAWAGALELKRGLREVANYTLAWVFY